MSLDSTAKRSEADKIVDGMNFGQLCDEFECISSPSVEATARQLARDILELREGNRALGTYAVSVNYKVFTHSNIRGFSLMTERYDDSYFNVKWFPLFFPWKYVRVQAKFPLFSPFHLRK